ncbi:hypothetical protein KJ854_05695 [Patescibacteria group bacterium]|nr:hypothetical protein [Patescibacteria group bacterium]
MENKINFQDTGKEKRKINPKEITSVHRTIIAANAMKKIIEERVEYNRLFEETQAACRLSNIELQIVEMRCQR